MNKQKKREESEEGLMLPKSRNEVLRWCRCFYNYEPTLQRCIDIRARYPITAFAILASDKNVEKFYRHVADGIDLLELMRDASLSLEKFGEAIPILTLQQDPLMDPEFKGNLYGWGSAQLIEPELLEIERDFFDSKPKYSMFVTEDMRRRCSLFKNIGSFPLDRYYVNPIIRKTDPSALRGTPIIQSLFKNLIFRDRIRIKKKVSKEDIAGLIYLDNEMLARMGVPESAIKSKEKIDKIKIKDKDFNRFCTDKRFTFEKWMVDHFFRPLAEKNRFVDKNGELILPQIAWRIN